MPHKLFMAHPKGYGKGSRECRVCGNRRGIVRKYDMNLCRRCFREQTTMIGFTKTR